MTSVAAVAESGPGDPPTGLSDARRLQAFAFGGLLLVLMNFSSPAGGMIDIPVSFFLKNRMHLQSNELAVFKLWIGLPLIVGFVFGFIRDRWSPFGGGDRAHLLVFGVATALIYGAMALVQPTYAVFLGGLFVATMAFRMVSSAAYGITNTLAQKHAVSGQMSSVISIGSALPDLISFIGGGLLSQTIEGHAAAAAARILFFCAAGLMLAIALLGVIGPKWIFAEARDARPAEHPLQDLKRIVRHWPIYPAMLIQLLWQFAPATGTVLQYHIVDHLHATDAQWGAWQGIFFGSFLPIYAAYGWISQKVALRRLLWIGFGLAVFQMAPLLLVHDAVGALIAAAPMGVLGSIAQAALVDLVIRSAPRGCQGMMMMLFLAFYYFSVRAGDLLGTWIYDKHGGFIPTVVVTIIVYALILPVILLVPKGLTSTKDGELIAARPGAT
jgi:MFS family permease